MASSALPLSSIGPFYSFSFLVCSLIDLIAIGPHCTLVNYRLVSTSQSTHLRQS